MAPRARKLWVLPTMECVPDLEQENKVKGMLSLIS